jgi:hypothetical protein
MALGTIVLVGHGSPAGIASMQRAATAVIGGDVTDPFVKEPTHDVITPCRIYALTRFAEKSMLCVLAGVLLELFAREHSLRECGVELLLVDEPPPSDPVSPNGDGGTVGGLLPKVKARVVADASSPPAERCLSPLL